MDFVAEARLINVVVDGMRQTYDQIAGQMPCHPLTAKKYLTRLIEAGVIAREGKGRRGAFVYWVNKDEAKRLGYI